MRQVAEGYRRHRCVSALRSLVRLHECGKLGVDPEFVMEALKQLQAWRQPPRELAEHLVLFVSPRKRRSGSRLTIVVAQVLVSGKEPQPIGYSRAAKIGGEVPILHPLVAALALARTGGSELHRLTRQGGGLCVIRRIVEKAIAALPRHHVDHGTLQVAEFGRRPDGLNLHLLDEVDARFGSRFAAARAGKIRAVDQKCVLVGA